MEDVNWCSIFLLGFTIIGILLSDNVLKMVWWSNVILFRAWRINLNQIGQMMKNSNQRGPIPEGLLEIQLGNGLHWKICNMQSFFPSIWKYSWTKEKGFPWTSFSECLRQLQAAKRESNANPIIKKWSWNSRQSKKLFVVWDSQIKYPQTQLPQNAIILWKITEKNNLTQTSEKKNSCRNWSPFAVNSAFAISFVQCRTTSATNSWLLAYSEMKNCLISSETLMFFSPQQKLNAWKMISSRIIKYYNDGKIYLKG